jgi:hypothetical protein
MEGKRIYVKSEGKETKRRHLYGRLISYQIVDSIDLFHVASEEKKFVENSFYCGLLDLNDL